MDGWICSASDAFNVSSLTRFRPNTNNRFLFWHQERRVSSKPSEPGQFVSGSHRPLCLGASYSVPGSVHALLFWGSWAIWAFLTSVPCPRKCLTGATGTCLNSVSSDSSPQLQKGLSASSSVAGSHPSVTSCTFLLCGLWEDRCSSPPAMVQRELKDQFGRFPKKSPNLCRVSGS